ncbi:alpha-amylase family glycosyl hydrolase [Paracraurococcus lichenis]|uniref:Alpha-amylase family glycosyl hydrolase n=1 Tax=Paracraurococcus lichenis TaxID=3064888 RepID=A0ABT9DW78_9PROT|nr:alpha-amylase family glycosyl hydrolase [Paracraurococcus sp. LOR1-02]MDO9708157.1 alpha-amylase family glycosyl hydrolase [Paracraurococcus sp. LOR1-02]
MQQADWWRGAVLYQVYPRSFADSDGDGIGDLAGLLQRIDHIAALSVDGIWLCPVYASPQRDFGYDVADHCAIDPSFGSLADFDRVLEAAHQRGLKVLVDLVGGHTSDQHPWFAASRRSKAAPTADWYVWADPSPDGTPPNNWLSVFGGSAWCWEPRRRQYFLHHFLPSQPTLNLQHPACLEALLDVARFWLDRGVDGFRLDAIDFLTHDERLRSNPAARPAGGQVPAKLFALQRHDHDMIQPASMAVLRRIRALLDEYPGAVSLGEVSSQDGAFDRIAAYTGAPDLLHMAYTLRPLRHGFDRPTLQALLRDAIATCARGWPCWSFSNHDVERAATRWAPHRTEQGGQADTRFTRLLLALLLSLPGSACLYQGEELGLPEAQLQKDEIRDPFGITYWPEFKGRDGSRTPMPWAEGERFAGFTPAWSSPWLPVPASHRALAVDGQERDPDSTLRFARRLIALRRAEPALRQGTAAPLDLPEPLFGFTREAAGQRVTLVFNLSGQPVPLPAQLEAGQAGLGGFGASGGVLPAYGFALLVPAMARVPEIA